MTWFGGSIPFVDIETSFLDQRDSFLKFAKEMDEFDSLSQEEYEARNPSLRTEILSSFPNYTEEQLQKHVISVASQEFQFTVRFHEKYKSYFIQIVILTHAFCEALINAILAFGLAENFSEHLFREVEKLSLLDKWIAGPARFDDSYEFPKSGTLYPQLYSLCKIRNALTHSKVTLERDGQRIFNGSSHKEISIKNVKMVKEFLDLPYDLLTYAGNNLNKFPNLRNSIFLFSRRKPEKLIHIRKRFKRVSIKDK
jgi:hypothetical protein